MKQLKDYETPLAELLFISSSSDFLVFSEETGDNYADDNFVDGFGFKF